MRFDLRWNGLVSAGQLARVSEYTQGYGVKLRTSLKDTDSGDTSVAVLSDDEPVLVLSTGHKARLPFGPGRFGWMRMAKVLTRAGVGYVPQFDLQSQAERDEQEKREESKER